MKIKSKIIFLCLLAITWLPSCTNKTNESPQAETQTGTPVTVTSVSQNLLTETIELNATSLFLLKTPIKSTSNGYLQNVKIKQGDFVSKGEVIMRIITKEAQSLGNTISNLDSSFHFKGEINIVATGGGYISQLNFQSGDYVQDGEQIALISDANSFAFTLELPYELTPLLRINKTVQLLLPDSSLLNGIIERPMPTVDAASQTQSYLISVSTNKMIPENLVAKVLLVKSSKQNATSIPKQAILTNETQSNFWVMKLMNDSTAIKVFVQKGIETNDKVEILSPQFSAADKILVSGNYGLPDTALVQIIK